MHLDLNLYTDLERNEAVAQMEGTFSNSQLERMADYILYGKTEDGESIVDKGMVQIETKYKSYSKRKNESLDELKENPLFDERTAKSPYKRQVYKNPKPVLDKTLPELQGLLDEIERLQLLYDAAIDTNPKNLTPTKIYHLKHLLIDLKKQQYTISMAAKPRKEYSRPIPFSPILSDGIIVLPLGLKMGDTTRFLNPRADTSLYTIPKKGDINLEDPHHIYLILTHYSILYESAIETSENQMGYLLETLDFYIELAGLDEVRSAILLLKRQEVSNTEIQKYLETKFGIHYNENYISTIYTKEISRKIAEAVTLHKDYWLQRNNPDAWKVCGCCGEYRLKDAREFVRKQSSLDGYTSRCKRCDRQKREKKKREAI